MQKQLHFGVAATAILAVLASALPADAQRRGGGRAATSISRPGGAGLERGGLDRPGTGAINGGDRANIGNNNRINTGDINVNVDKDWNHYGPSYGYGAVRPVQPIYRPYYPVAAGVAVGVAVGTAAAVGSRVYVLPPACSPYVYSAYTYYSCGGVYYRPSYQGDTIVYVVVSKPG